MCEFKISPSILWSTQDNPEKPHTIFFITCDNDHLYTYNLHRPGIWSYKLSEKSWTEVISLSNNLLPYPRTKIIGIVEDQNNSKKLKIFSMQNKITRIHTCDLETKVIEEQILDGSLPDTAQFCQMNVFCYNKIYYTVVCVETTNRADLLRVDVYRLKLDTWERVSNPVEASKCDIIERSSMGIINSSNKMYLFYSKNINSIRVFDLEKNTWSWVGTSDPNQDQNLNDHCDSDLELEKDLNIFRRDKSGNDDVVNVKMDQPPIGSYNYSMSKYCDPDTKDTCLIVSASKYRNINNTPTEIWKFNLSTLQWGLIDRVGIFVNQQRVSRWACITPNGRLVTRDGLIVNDPQNPLAVIHREYIYTTWTKFVDNC
ncbi:uncharacterized protein LOC123261661 [Cotesia glomerata]|uniref:Uncharacterized protein n=1 Tax=Cotesia glomerata TaxID=32391 RepID=A0AAV7I7M2_COTGL|nr:uncharacterized protein LOC123261661 [Cotesia glomerata]KAH0548765.1 hypothetical protein KQX54_002220 [Cotesia glomerata]